MFGPKKAQCILGHATIAQTMEVYARLRGDAAPDAVNQVPGPTSGFEKLAAGEERSQGLGSPGVPLRALKDGQARSAPDKGGRGAADGTC